MEKITGLLDENKGLLYNQGYCMVCKDGQTVYSRGVDADADSLFDLASLSKILTGTMVLRLIGEKKVALTDKLDKVFAEKALGETTRQRFADITVQDLLIHASGFPAWYPFFVEKASFWDILEGILQRNPPQEAVYSDINFLLLGEMIRHLTGRELRDNLAALNEALGTNFQYNPQNKAACVPTERGNRYEMNTCAKDGYAFDGWRSTDVLIQGEVHDGNSWYFGKGEVGHAGVFGSAKDVLRLCQMYLNAGESIIPEDLVRESFRDYGNARGLMWDLGPVFANGVGHTGFTGTALWICPEKNLAAALLCSRMPLYVDGQDPPNLQPFRTEVFAAAYAAN